MQTSISFKICFILFLHGELKSKDIHDKIKKQWGKRKYSPIPTYESLRSTVYRMERAGLIKVVSNKKPKKYTLTRSSQLEIEIEIINLAILKTTRVKL